MSSLLLTPTTEHRSSSLMPSCPPPPNPPPSLHRLNHYIDLERRRPSHTSAMADINRDEGEELIGFILVAPLGSSNTFVQRAASSSTNAKNMMGVSVSPKKVLCPRPVSPSIFE
mmetsp:Transcript_15423/g.22967  ORF Transcript_15423/g.22967 Transcript_15423/m.22967 type:complete len:114 (+) Transcript_15423:120-461(+)